MKVRRLAPAALLAAALLGGGWVALSHPEWVRPHAEEGEEPVEPVVPVRVGTVRRLTFHRWIEGWGSVSAEPAHEGRPPASALVASPATGVLAAVLCSEGQRVDKGATLFQLDTRMASADAQTASAARASAKATLDRLTVTVEFAARELERTKKLFAENLISDKDLRTAELTLASAEKDLSQASAKVVEADKTALAAQTRAALLRIQAPLSGTVVRVNVNPGEAVQASTALADIVDLERLVVAAAIPAVELRFLRRGQPVEIIIDERSSGDAPPLGQKDPDPAEGRAEGKGDAAKHEGAATKAGGEGPEAVARGQLSFIGLDVDTRNDSARVLVSFPKEAGLRPGQYVRVRIAVEERAGRLAVPRESVVRVEDANAVSVVEGDRATQKPVSLGLTEGSSVEVEGDGLREGMTVVTAGAYGLSKQTKIRIVRE